MKKGVAAWCVAVMVVVLVAAVHETAAVDCSASKLSPCLGSIMGGQKPSAKCCSKLKEQQPCFCDFKKDPTLRQYVESPNAKKVAAVCGVTIPEC